MKKAMTILISSIIFLSALFMAPVSEVNAVEYNVNIQLKSKSIYLENLDTETVVYSKEPDERRFPASTTKIMTYIITAEHVSDFEHTQVTVKDEVLSLLDGTGSSVAGLENGEKLTVYQLLNCLMIPSGNDAALVLADYIGGGDISKFVDMMNDKARELGCGQTHFANPHGLNDPNHYTTVSDMAKITKYALTLPSFAEISDTVTSDCLGEDRYLVTTNYMIDENRGGEYYYPYAKGIKTGSTGNDSGYCLVSTASKNGYTYLCVAYGAPYEDENGEAYDNGAMLDSAGLYKWAFENLSIKTIIEKNDLTREIDLSFAWNKDKLRLKPAQSYSTIMPNDVSIDSIDKVYDIPDSVEAPVKEGQKLGTLTLSYANQKIAEIDLLAGESVDRSELLSAVAVIKEIVSSNWFITVFIVICSLVLIYFIIAAVYNKRKNSSRAVKKKRKF